MTDASTTRHGRTVRAYGLAGLLLVAVPAAAAYTAGSASADYRASAPAVAPAFAGAVWDRLAFCESTNRWHINSGNGFFGGLQITRETWREFGGHGYAVRPDLASRVQQIAVAERILVVQGWQAWPVCSRKTGLSNLPVTTPSPTPPPAPPTPTAKPQPPLTAPVPPPAPQSAAPALLPGPPPQPLAPEPPQQPSAPLPPADAGP